MGEIFMIKKGLNKRLAEVGKIKIGGKGEEHKKTGGNGTYRRPVRYDHFVITTTERDPKTGNYIPDAQLMKAIAPENGKPTEIPVVFLFDDIDMNFNTSFAFYQGAKCICRGDGEKASRLFDKKGKPSVFKITDNESGTTEAGERHEIICDPDTCPMMQEDKNGATKCKPSGILSVLIPMSMNIGGVYRFRTHSWNTISNILASLELIKTITNGVLVGLPMKMQYLKKTTVIPGTNTPTTIGTVNVVFDGETQQEMRQLAFTELKNRSEYGIDILQLETRARQAGFMEDTDDPADVEEEFYSSVEDQEPEEKKDIKDRASSVLGNVDPSNVIDVSEDPEPEIPYEPKNNQIPEKKESIGKPLDSEEFKSVESVKEDPPIDEEQHPEEEQESDGLEIF